MATYMCKSFLPFFILVSFCFIARTDAVICAVKHPQTVVCEAGFVIRATVLSVAAKTCVYNNSNIAVPIASAAFLPASSQNGNFIPTEKIITVRLDKLFKGYKVINNKKGTLLKINFQSPFSVPLQPGMQYLLTGFLINGKLHMNSCSWYQFWSMTTVTQYYGLRRYYWMYCRCKVEHCSNRICRRTLRNCLWKPDNLSSAIGKMDCHSRYSICMVRNGRCTLHNPKGGRICLLSKTEISNEP